MRFFSSTKGNKRVVDFETIKAKNQKVEVPEPVLNTGEESQDGLEDNGGPIHDSEQPRVRLNQKLSPVIKFSEYESKFHRKSSMQRRKTPKTSLRRSAKDDLGFNEEASEGDFGLEAPNLETKRDLVMKEAPEIIEGEIDDEEKSKRGSVDIKEFMTARLGISSSLFNKLDESGYLRINGKRTTSREVSLWKLQDLEVFCKNPYKFPFEGSARLWIFFKPANVVEFPRKSGEGPKDNRVSLSDYLLGNNLVPKEEITNRFLVVAFICKSQSFDGFCGCFGVPDWLGIRSLKHSSLLFGREN